MENKVNAIIETLKNRYPQALCALHYQTDYQLMIAVRLSAQCTDARVNLVTPALFAAYPTPQAFAEAKVEDVEELIIDIDSFGQYDLCRKFRRFCGKNRKCAKEQKHSCRVFLHIHCPFKFNKIPERYTYNLPPLQRYFKPFHGNITLF